MEKRTLCSGTKSGIIKLPFFNCMEEKRFSVCERTLKIIFYVMFKNFSQKSRYCQCLICSYLNVFTDKNVHECIQKQTLLEKQIWFLTFLLPGWKVEKLPWQTTPLSSILQGDFTKVLCT